MSEKEKNTTKIYGDIEKLTQIGTVKGNVYIINKESSMKKINEDRKKKYLPFTSEDITDYVNVVLNSNRFGKKVKVTVPRNMTISAFINFIVELLEFPRTVTRDELMLSLKYRYSIIFQGKKISLNRTLYEAGIIDDSEIELFIQITWFDELKKIEREEQKMNIMYEMGSRMIELRRREEIRCRRGRINLEKIRELSNPYFNYIDEL